MEKHLTFLLLLVIATLFTNLPVQAQSLPASKLQASLTELKDPRHQSFNDNEGFMKIPGQFFQNTTFRLNFADLSNRDNSPKTFKNSDELVYDYDSVYFYKTSGNFLREFATRDASGKLLTEITQEWLPGNNFWRNSSKYTYTYDVSGNLVSGIFQTWSDGNTAWVDYEKADCTYDASGNMLSGIYQLWDAGNSTWLNSHKEIMEYDGLDNLISRVLQNWDNGNNIWLNYIKNDFTYNSAGNEISIVSQNWEAGTNTWVNGVKISSTYDGSENVLHSLIEYWDIGGSIWVNDFQVIYTYDISGNLTTFISQFWDDGSSAWVNSWYKVFTYDATGNMLTEVGQLWNTETSTWGNYSNYIYTWDDSQNLLSETGQDWDTGSNSWLNDSKREFQYDYDIEKLLATYYDWYDAWVPANGTININLFGNNLFWGYEIHKIEFYYSTYVSGIEDKAGKGNNALDIYPNPAGNTVNLKFNSPSTVSGTIMLFDQFGKVVKEIPTGNLLSGENTLTMDVSSLAAGIYLVKFNNGGFYETQKLVISR